MESPSTVATVAVAAPLDKTLSYVVPPALLESARVGVRVRVPLGRRRAVGYLLELADADPSGLKALDEVLDGAPLFPPEMVPFFRRAAEYYCHPLGEVIRTALPAGLSGRGAEVRHPARERLHPCGQGRQSRRGPAARNPRISPTSGEDPHLGAPGGVRRPPRPPQASDGARVSGRNRGGALPRPLFRAAGRARSRPSSSRPSRPERFRPWTVRFGRGAFPPFSFTESPAAARPRST